MRAFGRNGSAPFPGCGAITIRQIFAKADIGALIRNFQ